jgi:tetratricopeptide (TPR) repeat protein
VSSLVPTDIFFADVEQVISSFTEADSPRAQRLIQELERIAADVPRVASQCHAYQARLSAKLKDYTAALRSIERALQLKPLDHTLLTLRGDLHREAQALPQALSDYSRALEINPEAVTARMRRAEVHQAGGDLAAALHDINAALEQEPRALRLLYRRALIFVELRRTVEAIHDLRLVAQASPDPDLKRKAEERLRELGER